MPVIPVRRRNACITRWNSERRLIRHNQRPIWALWTIRVDTNKTAERCNMKVGTNLKLSRKDVKQIQRSINYARLSITYAPISSLQLVALWQEWVKTFNFMYLYNLFFIFTINNHTYIIKFGMNTHNSTEMFVSRLSAFSHKYVTHKSRQTTDNDINGTNDLSSRHTIAIFICFIVVSRQKIVHGQTNV